jgi:hypothetical protein
MEGGAPDPVAITTWHQALGASTAVEVPHDLFALWLYSASGGIVLLGPDGLSRDRIEIPLPDPELRQDQLYRLEELLRRARYPSAIAIPVRRGGRDVALMLLGSFDRAAFGPKQALALRRLATALESTLSELAQVMPSVSPHPAVEPAMSADALPLHLARAAVEAAGGADLVRRVSGVVQLSGGALLKPVAALVRQFGDAPTLLLDEPGDLGAEGGWSVGSGAAPAQARAVIGVRLDVAGATIGYMLLGSVARDAYRPQDEDTLALAALFIAPRVDALRARE